MALAKSSKARRIVPGAISLVLVALGPRGLLAEPAESTAQAEPSPDAAKPAPAADREAEATRLAWHDEYERAQAALLAERDQEAALLFERLIYSARTTEDRRVAEEFTKLARARVARERLRREAPHLRTTDELSILYTTAFIYGFGSSGWLALQIKPQTFPGAVLPFIGITTATVGGVAIADNYRPFRLGVPQAIAAGMYLGLGEGIWLIGYQHSRATRRDDGSHWKSETVSTLLWTSATVGAATGGIVGGLREPKPGEASLTTSAALWSGLFGSFLGPALQPDEERAGETGFITGGIGYNLGLLAGWIAAQRVSPSIARVRFVDLGGLAGGLLGAGGYLLAAGDDAEPRSGLLAAALGLGSGLGLAWWATDGVDAEVGGASATRQAWAPTLMPVDGGWMVGASGTL
jgi:hypothetical protein